MLPPLPRRHQLARQYKRRSDGKFGSGSTTVKQDEAGHRKIKADQKKKLNIGATAGTRRKKKLTTKAKAKGHVVKTKQAKNSGARARKRFG